MFQRYTANALKDILNAEEEAKRTGQTKIGTSHLLIGIIKNRRSMISVVLKDYGITLTRVRKEVKKIVFEGGDHTKGKLPLGIECKSLLKEAFRISRKEGFDIFDSEDILFGIINSEGTDAYEIISNLKINFDTLFYEINEIKRKKYGSSSQKYYSSYKYPFKYEKENNFNYSDNEKTKNLNPDEEFLINKLKTIGITEYKQLIENDIFYWWQKKYRDVQKNNQKNQNELLIDINSAKEDLELASKQNLLKILKTNESKKSNANAYRKVENNSYRSKKSNANPYRKVENKSYRSKKNNSKHYKKVENKRNSSTKNNDDPNQPFYLFMGFFVFVLYFLFFLLIIYIVILEIFKQ